MKVRGKNSLKFEVDDTVATGMISAGIVTAVDQPEPEPEPELEPEPEPPRKTRSTRAK